MAAGPGVNGSADAPHELDVVEVIVDGAEAPRGTRGTIVDDPGTGTFLLEVVDAEGRTLSMPAVSRDQLRVVWRAGTASPDAPAPARPGA